MSNRLNELANNPDLISGVYNYCDRWCERCPLTSRCLVYATESETENNDIQNNDIQNAAFWQTLTETLAEVRQLIPEWTKQAPDKSAQDNSVRNRSRKVDHHPLAKAGKEYANAASEWFRELDQSTETASNLHHDAREVIQWYQYQIAVKTMRALSSRSEDEDCPEDPKDSDGSAKVALIGIDRSIAAWHLLQLSSPDRAESIVPLILQLERLRNNLEATFSEARQFIRPGFDQLAA